MDQIQILHQFHIAGGGIQPGMIHPLVRDDQRSLRGCQMRDGVLRQHCHVIGSDQFRYAVIDLRVNMVGAACQYNPSFSSLL